MTAPTPPNAPAGLATLEALILFLENLAAQVAPQVQTVITELGSAFKTLELFLDPAAGRETERESLLAAMLASKDLAGLQAFYNDVPAHPNKSRAICAGYIKLLGGSV